MTSRSEIVISKGIPDPFMLWPGSYRVRVLQEVDKNSILVNLIRVLTSWDSLTSGTPSRLILSTLYDSWVT